MFQYERPNIPVPSPETGPLYNYLYRFVEYCNVMLNHIGADQIDNVEDLLKSFAASSEDEAPFFVNSGSTKTKIRARKVTGIVFLQIGAMESVPSGDTTLTTLSEAYRPAQDEICDYTTPDGKAFRITVKSSGTVIIHSYSTSTLPTVDSNVRMIYPTANI